MIKPLILVLTVSAAMGATLRSPAHGYWFLKDRPVAGADDSKWNYCDYKCLSLENLVSQKDFVVVEFSAVLKERFSACYVKSGDAYTLWSKVVENKFYEKLCGEDYKDWMAEGSFNVDRIYGVGIGAIINESELYK